MACLRGINIGSIQHDFLLFILRRSFEVTALINGILVIAFLVKVVVAVAYPSVFHVVQPYSGK